MSSHGLQLQPLSQVRTRSCFCFACEDHLPDTFPPIPHATFSVSLSSNESATPASVSQESAMGIVYQAATGRSTGWTTGSGLAGPTEIGGQLSPDGRGLWPPLLSKSPRRSKAVEFTCNKCGGRTQRAINPHAYTSGTVFVQVPRMAFFAFTPIFVFSRSLTVVHCHCFPSCC